MKSKKKSKIQFCSKGKSVEKSILVQIIPRIICCDYLEFENSFDRIFIKQIVLANLPAFSVTFWFSSLRIASC